MDKQIEEKKLTDEKSMFNYIANDVLGQVKPLYLRKRIVREVFDLIHSLQGENAEQKAEIERLTKWKDKLQDTKDELEQQLIDTGFKEYCEENKRLTEENAELQKQVDELKKGNGQLVTIGNGFALERNNLQEELDELKKSGRKIPENAVVLTEKEYKRYERIEKIIKLAKREKANGYEVKNGKLYYFSNMLDGFEYEFKDLQEICDAANHYNEEFCGLDQRLAFWQGKAEETRKETAEKFAERLKKELIEWLEDNEDLNGKIDFGVANIEIIGVETLEGEVISEGLIDKVCKKITEGKANASKTKL